MRRPAAALVLVGLLAACAADDPAPRPKLSLEPSTTTTTDPAVVALAELLPTAVGERFDRADDVLGAGPLDLAAAAEAGPDPNAERATLEADGFRRGVSRAWAAPPSDTVYLALYEFGAAAGAAAYQSAQVAALERRKASEVPVSGLEGARIFTLHEGELTTHAVLLQRGNRWVLVLAASETGAFQPDEPAEIAEGVAARL